MISSAECSIWYAVFLTITVVVIAVNPMSIIILFVKNSTLRTRAMYLVINLTVADMFVGGMGTFDIVFHSLLYGCEVGNELFPIGSIIANQEWEPFIVLAMVSMWLPLTSVAGIAESSYFFRSYACDVLSI